MSLVNDALKKARMEAARGEAANRGVPYPALGHGERASSRAWIAALGGFLILAGLGGFLLFRAGKQSALRTETAELVRPSSGAEAAAPGATDAASRSAGTVSDESSGQAAPRPADSGTSSSEPVAGSSLNPPPARGDADGRQAPPAAAVVEPSGPTRTAGTVAPERGSESAPASRLEPEPEPEREPEPKPEPTKNRPARATATPTPSTPDPPTGSQSSGRSAPAGDPAPSETPRRERSAAVEVLRSADIPGVGPVELGGIAWSGDRPFALLNGRVVRPGDSVSGLMVAEIQSNTVRLSGAAGDWVLKLK